MSAIQDGIRDRFELARVTVSNAIESIKGIMRFDWSLPKLKLPHFSIQGEFSLNPPSIPKIGVEWYAKAMDSPYLLKNATIFGSAGGHLLGAGEAGTEIVAGAETLMRMIASAVTSSQKISRAIHIASGGISIHIHATPGMDVERLAEEVMDRLNADLLMEGI